MLDRSTQALPAVRLGSLSLGNPCLEARREYTLSVIVLTPLLSKSFSPSHQLLEDFLIKLVQQAVRSVKEFLDMVKRISEMAPQDLARTGCRRSGL